MVMRNFENLLIKSKFYYTKIGEWQGDEMHGEGVMFFSYGGYAKGKYRKNRIHGYA